MPTVSPSAFQSDAFQKLPVAFQDNTIITDSAQVLDVPFTGRFILSEVYNVVDQAAQSNGTFSVVAASSVADSTRNPSSAGVLLTLTNGTLVLVYQAGSQGLSGLVYRVRANTIATWSGETQISSRQDVIPTAQVQRSSGDIHICYSVDEATPSLATTRSVYYRRLTNLGSSFLMGSELVLAAGTASLAYTRASMGMDTDEVPFVLAIRTTATTTTVACLIGAAPGNLAGAALSTNVAGVSIFSSDVLVAAAGSGQDWYMALSSAGTVWMLRASGPNGGLSSVTFSNLTSFGADSGTTLSTTGHTGGPMSGVHVAYIRSGNLYVRFWDTVNLSLTGEQFVTGSVVAASISHDANYPWVFFLQVLGSKQIIGFASAQYGFATSVLATSSSETWAWPNSVKRIDDAQVAAVAWCTTAGSPNSVYVGQSAISIPKAASDSAVAADTVRTALRVSQLLSAAETLNNAVRAQDSGALVSEIVNAFGNPKVNETYLVTDSARIFLNVLQSCVVSLTVGMRQVVPDSGSVDDTNVRSVELKSTSDAGTMVELAKSERKIFETYLLTDIIQSIHRLVTDDASAAELAGIRQTVAEVIVAGDVAAISVILQDAATAAELLGRVIGVLDSAIVSDIDINSARLLTENVTAVDITFFELVVREAAVGLDVPEVTIRAVATFLRLLAQYNRVQMDVEGNSR